MDIHLIPYEDIELFLNTNEHICSIDKEFNYKQVSTMLMNNQIEFASTIIIDWYLANNIRKLGIKLPKTSVSYIKESSDEDLEYIVEHLEIKIYDKERIIRIMDYLGLLIQDDQIISNDSCFQIFNVESISDLYKWMDFKSMIRMKMVYKWFQKCTNDIFELPTFYYILGCSMKYHSLRNITYTKLWDYNTEELLKIGRAQYYYPNVTIEHQYVRKKNDIIRDRYDLKNKKLKHKFLNGMRQNMK